MEQYSLKYIPLTMIRHHMDHIPVLACPAGYSLRTFVPGDEQHWSLIETLAGEFETQEMARQRFEAYFGPARAHLTDRFFILENEQGEPIGTTAAWYGELAGEERGRISWVAIIPDYQGRGLAKPLLSTAMQRLARDHRSSYLTTQTTSYRAINLYLNFGFVPYLMGAGCQEGWMLMEAVLGRKIL